MGRYGSEGKFDQKLTLKILKWVIPGFFLVYFCSFQTIYRIKIVNFSGIWTRIFGIIGEHADHLTTPALPFTVKIYHIISLIYGLCPRRIPFLPKRILPSIRPFFLSISLIHIDLYLPTISNVFLSHPTALSISFFFYTHQLSLTQILLVSLYIPKNFSFIHMTSLSLYLFMPLSKHVSVSLSLHLSHSQTFSESFGFTFSLSHILSFLLFLSFFLSFFLPHSLPLLPLSRSCSIFLSQTNILHIFLRLVPSLSLSFSPKWWTLAATLNSLESFLRRFTLRRHLIKWRLKTANYLKTTHIPTLSWEDACTDANWRFVWTLNGKLLEENVTADAGWRVYQSLLTL